MTNEATWITVDVQGEGPTTLYQINTGNGGPDLWMDARHRAFWSDGSRVTEDECARIDGCELLTQEVKGHALTVLGFKDEDAAARGIESEITL